MLLNSIENAFFSVARKLGLFPCDTNFRITANLFTYSFFIILSFNVVSLLGNFYLIQGTASSSNTLQLWLTILKSIFNNVFVFMHIVRLRVVAGRFVSVLRLYKSLPPGILSKTKFKFRAVFITGIVRHVVIAVALFMTIDESNASSVFVEASSFYVNFSSFMVILLFCSFVEILNSYFEHLINGMSTDAASIESKLDWHDRLRRIAKKLNDLFSWQILLGCFNKSVNTVVYVFLAVDIVMQGTLGYEEIRNLIIFSEHAIWEMFNLYFLSAFSSQITNSFGLLGNEVLKLVREERKLYKSDKIQLYLLRRQDFEISACGYFSVGYHLLIVVATTSCTYLVVLVQSFS